MTGTEMQRRRSARLLGGLLGAQAFAALVGAVISLPFQELEPVEPYFVGLAYLALFVVASSGALLEWRRHPLAERFALLAGALGAPLTMLAMINGWWIYVPLVGVTTLTVFLALAYRFSVRDDTRHKEISFST